MIPKIRVWTKVQMSLRPIKVYYGVRLLRCQIQIIVLPHLAVEQAAEQPWGMLPLRFLQKTLKLYKDDDSYWMGIYHKSNSSCTVDLYNGAMVSSTYPPSYSYTASGSKATYTLNFTTQTYIPYYGTYTYAQFQEKITLQFSSSTKGTYSGTQRNMNGESKSISGNFQIQ